MSPAFRMFDLPKKDVIGAVKSAVRDYWRENGERLPYLVVFSLRDMRKLQRGPWKGGTQLEVPVRLTSDCELPIGLYVIYVGEEVLEKGRFGVTGRWPPSS